MVKNISCWNLSFCINEIKSGRVPMSPIRDININQPVMKQKKNFQQNQLLHLKTSTLKSAINFLNNEIKTIIYTQYLLCGRRRKE
jgi:hypothetical protein